LAGKILAEAAAIYDGKNATQSQSYGPEARGGASRSEVVISDGDIDYPKASNIDFLVAFTQESCDKYIPDLKPGGILLVDSKFVKRTPEVDVRVYRLPMTDIAEKTTGRALVANLVALGAFVEISQVVSKEAMEQAILSRVPRGTEELNRRAFQAGMDSARSLDES
jgi:2-oxoglutarate ferredoxin oxidoreductase subunit gamma